MAVIVQKFSDSKQNMAEFTDAYMCPWAKIAEVI